MARVLRKWLSYTRMSDVLATKAEASQSNVRVGAMNSGAAPTGYGPIGAIAPEPRIASIQGRMVLGRGSARLNVAVPLGSASTDGARPPKLSGQ